VPGIRGGGWWYQRGLRCLIIEPPSWWPWHAKRMVLLMLCAKLWCPLSCFVSSFREGRVPGTACRCCCDTVSAAEVPVHDGIGDHYPVVAGSIGESPAGCGQRWATCRLW
jgi:hypothetical protein